MKNKMEDLRNHLFATLEALQDTDKPMEIERAKAVAEVAGKLIESAKVEVQFMQVTGLKTDSSFMGAIEQLPSAPKAPRLVGRG